MQMNQIETYDDFKFEKPFGIHSLYKRIQRCRGLSIVLYTTNGHHVSAWEMESCSVRRHRSKPQDIDICSYKQVLICEGCFRSVPGVVGVYIYLFYFYGSHLKINVNLMNIRMNTQNIIFLF